MQGGKITATTDAEQFASSGECNHYLAIRNESALVPVRIGGSGVTGSSGGMLLAPGGTIVVPANGVMALALSNYYASTASSSADVSFFGE